jgi:hypothetical protein
MLGAMRNFRAMEVLAPKKTAASEDGGARMKARF